MANNKKGLEMLLKAGQDLKQGKLTVEEFLHQIDVICFNYIGSRAVGHFSDGYERGTTSNIAQYVLKAVNGNKKALRRLEVDLEVVDVILTIKQVE